MKTNRGIFLGSSATTALAAALGIPSFAVIPTVAAGQDESDTCYDPAPGKIPTPWQLPAVTSVGTRLSAFDPNYNWTLLEQAYTKMRNLDPPAGSTATPPYNSLAAQRNMHAWFCATCSGTATDIHGAYSFMPWHRGFLYFHERILGSLVNDMTLRLPYWDWENASHRTVPNQYYDTPLFDPTRFLKKNQSVVRQICHSGPPAFMGTAAIGDLMLLPFDAFAGEGGASPSAGTPENTVHGYVHNSVGGVPSVKYDQFGNPVGCYPDNFCDLPCSNPGGDMSDLNRASRDPVFYAHHANIDRLWWSWENYPGNADASGGFRNQKFPFYDEKGNWVSITVNQMIPTEKTLGYTYSTRIAPAVPQRPRNIPLLVSTKAALRLPHPGDPVIRNAKATTINLRRLEFTGPGMFQVQAGGHVLGEFFVVSHGKPHGTHREPVRHANLSFAIAPGVAASLNNATITVHRGPNPARGIVNFNFNLAPARPAKVDSASLSVR